jgi:hypothetical protein
MYTINMYTINGMMGGNHLVEMELIISGGKVYK